MLVNEGVYLVVVYDPRAFGLAFLIGLGFLDIALLGTPLIFGSGSIS